MTTLSQPVLDFAATEEQEDFRRSLRAYVERHASVRETRRLLGVDAGYDRQVWDALSQQLALPGLVVPEASGGDGFGMPELAIVFEELGRHLVPTPCLPVILAAIVLSLVDDQTARRELLPGILSGDVLATIAVSESRSAWLAEDVSTVAESRPRGQFALTGEKRYVPYGNVADVLLVAARHGDGVSMFVVDSSAPGLTRIVQRTVDQTQRLVRLKLDATPAQLLGTEGRAWPILETVFDCASICVAAGALGGAEAVLRMAVEYAKERVQFGRPIGSFQAIKHKCADMALEVDCARSAVVLAAQPKRIDRGLVAESASLAKLYCCEAFSRAAAQNIQIHGGIGMTWEHDAHLFLKRSKSSELLFGGPSFHRARIAASLGI
jgi:alkylation response protein AidB-like acyl-CoA dehydrogenase